VDYFKLGGLVTLGDQNTENNNLFYAQYLTLGGKNIYNYDKVMSTRRTSSGLYMRSPLHLHRSVSHDELTAYFINSKILNTQHRFEIWKQLKKHLGSYPAIIESKMDYLPFNPGNYYAWGDLSESKLGWVSFPMYLINLLIATAKPAGNTSSKIIYWLELSNMSDNVVNRWLKRIYEKKMKKMYGENYLYALYSIYFANESRTEFPLWVELSKSIKYK
jgi:hypothetical protein